MVDDLELMKKRLRKRIEQLKYDRDHLPQELSGQRANYYIPAILEAEGRLARLDKLTELEALADE